GVVLVFLVLDAGRRVGDDEITFAMLAFPPGLVAVGMSRRTGSGDDCAGLAAGGPTLQPLAVERVRSHGIDVLAPQHGFLIGALGIFLDLPQVLSGEGLVVVDAQANLDLPVLARGPRAALEVVAERAPAEDVDRSRGDGAEEQPVRLAAHPQLAPHLPLGGFVGPAPIKAHTRDGLAFLNEELHARPVVPVVGAALVGLDPHRLDGTARDLEVMRVVADGEFDGRNHRLFRLLAALGERHPDVGGADKRQYGPVDGGQAAHDGDEERRRDSRLPALVPGPEVDLAEVRKGFDEPTLGPGGEAEVGYRVGLETGEPGLGLEEDGGRVELQGNRPIKWLQTASFASRSWSSER